MELLIRACLYFHAYLLEVLCSKIQKNPDSVPGVAKSYTSNPPPSSLLDEIHLDVVRGLIELRGFHPDASTSGVRRSDADTSDKGKQICFMLMPRT